MMKNLNPPGAMHRRTQRNIQRRSAVIDVMVASGSVLLLSFVAMSVNFSRTTSWRQPLSSQLLRSSSGLPQTAQFSRIFLSRTDQNNQWKTRRRPVDHQNRRVLYDKTEWDEDDDDDTAHFHLEDDDATNTDAGDSNGKIDENNTIIEPSTNVTETDANEDANSDETKPSKNGNGKQNNNQDKGIIYSENAGSKESDLRSRERPPPPPPPPHSSENVNDDLEKDNINKEKKRSKKEHSTLNNANTKNHKKRHNNNPQSAESEEDHDDTILDDLSRGFFFAAAFCLCLVCLYKCCRYACVRCGFLPDERVMEARWRRWQLKKKKSYHKADDDSVPPLDTRKWGQWMAERAGVGGNEAVAGFDGGVWDPLTNDLEQQKIEFFKDEDNSNGVSKGFIEFDDNAGVEMKVWLNSNDHGASSDMVLEYGEGDELEDKSHDSRLFDDEDHGTGVAKEADKFFKSKGRGNNEKREKKNGSKESNNGGDDDSDDGGSSNNDCGITDLDDHAASNCQTQAGAQNDERINSSGGLFFDALPTIQPPSGEKDSTPLLDSLPGYNNPPSSAMDSVHGNPCNVVDHLNDENNSQHDITEDDAVDSSVNDRGSEFRSSMIATGDRGYDEETDLLGLRSDSPPPLDLKEIEKNLLENMDKAKYY